MNDEDFKVHPVGEPTNFSKHFIFRANLHFLFEVFEEVIAGGFERVDFGRGGEFFADAE